MLKTCPGGEVHRIRETVLMGLLALIALAGPYVMILLLDPGGWLR